MVPEEKLKRGLLVHVEGWNYAAQFRFLYVDSDGFYVLETPKTHKIYTTTRNLVYTNRVSNRLSSGDERAKTTVHGQGRSLRAG